ncbi:hypothetical protein DBR06_SOUSAS36710003, partial [Sousa chinensis]
GHSKRVDNVAWHSIVCRIPFSSSCDNLVIIWHVRIRNSFIDLNGVDSDKISNISW